MIAHAMEEAQHLLAVLSDSHTPPPERAAAARDLATAGDPRSGVGVQPDGIPDIAWQHVPAGEFVYQAGESLMLPAFDIARYPVTAAQFDAFINAPDGFRKRGWWAELPLREYVPDRSAQQFANHPAVGVSWCAALAFTRWLSVRTGETITLPTEAQWEKAARGTDARRYPWGYEPASDRANINETARRTGPYYLERPCAVGLYPRGASPYDVEDLIGNVWEWCRNTFCDPDDDDLSSDAERAMRGGAWSNDATLDAITRDLDLPDYGYDGVGFRVVRLRD